MDIDHACHNRACFNPAHLRVATRSQNNQNQRGAYRVSKSGVRGVCWHKQNKKWHAQVAIDRRTRSLGFFDRLEDAEKAVTEWRREHYEYSLMDQLIKETV